MTFGQLAHLVIAAHCYADSGKRSTRWPQMSKLEAWKLFSKAVNDYLPDGANIEAPSTIVGNFREEFPEVETTT